MISVGDKDFIFQAEFDRVTKTAKTHNVMSATIHDVRELISMQQVDGNVIKFSKLVARVIMKMMKMKKMKMIKKDDEDNEDENDDDNKDDVIELISIQEVNANVIGIKLNFLNICDEIFM